MIDRNVWFSRIHEILLEISDRELQRELWFGKKEGKISSYDEVMCQLFDDFAIWLFIKEDVISELGFPRAMAKDFEKLIKIIDRHEPILIEGDTDDLAIIESQDWIDLSKITKEYLEKWQVKIDSEE